jgi:hypothetical protein
MSVSSLTLLFLSAFLTLFGLVPCLGWLNWVALPLCLVTVVVGVMGLVSDKDPATGKSRGRNAHLMAVIFGLMLAALSFLRWVLGGFVI